VQRFRAQQVADDEVLERILLFGRDDMLSARATAPAHR